MTLQARARAYLAKVPPAVAGQRGHAVTFQAACRLVEFGLPWDDAWPLLMEWNSGCQPPWGEGELHHKLADAFRRAGPRPDFAQRNEAQRLTWKRPPVAHPKPEAPCAPAEASRTPNFPALPSVGPGTPQAATTLAALRGVSLAAVSDAVSRGLVRFGVFRGLAAWFVLDDTRQIAQARRLDGRPWADGVKAWTLRHSNGRWPVGLRGVCRGKVAHLVEGGPDVLGLLHLAHLMGGAEGVAPVAMLGGAARIDSSALPLIHGMDFVCHPHRDEAGSATASRWAYDLSMGLPASVRFSRLEDLVAPAGQAPKDLNEVAHWATPSQAAALLNPTSCK